MNDILDAVSARIKAPYFGYSLLAFIAFNWRGIFLLTVTEGDPMVRLAVFDGATSPWTLLVLPLLVGAVVAATAQWVRYAFGVVAKKPLELIDEMRLVAEDKSLMRKARLERSRNELLAAREEDVIARAERDQQVSEIADPELRDQVAADLEKLREERDASATIPDSRPAVYDLSDAEIELLKAAASNRTDGTIVKLEYLSGRQIEAGKRTFGGAGAREYALYDYALDQLVRKGLVVQTSSTSYHVSHSGWQVIDLLV